MAQKTQSRGDNPARILVVDDEEVVLLSIRKVFKGSEYDLDTVQSPQLGLAMMESKTYDIVITDLMMPGMNGLEFLEKVRQMDPACRVIMITGYATMRTALQSMRRGAFDFLAKPFTKVELSNMVHRAMKRGAMTSASPDKQSKGMAESSGIMEPGTTYILRNHSWAKIENDLSVSIGAEESFTKSIGDLLDIELPEEGETVSQGAGCAKLISKDGRNYTLWCPLSGRVLSVNPKVADDASILNDNSKTTWIIKIDPTAIENEVKELID